MPATPPVAQSASTTLRPLQLSTLLLSAKSRTIGDLRDAIRKYNFLLPTFQLQKRANRIAYTLDKSGVALLDRMCVLLMTYLASKPPASRKPSGRQKWQDAADFVLQLHTHAEHFNIKLLHGDFDADDNYWLERFDPEHGDLGNFDDFMVWMRQTNKTRFLRSGSKGDLEYLSEIERESYRVEREHGPVCYVSDGTPLDTSDGFGTLSKLEASYIYVCSALTKNVYTFYSSCRVMHHSSFLQGEPVIAAGDWVVEKGEVRIVNGQSGHYRTTFENMRAFALTGRRFWGPNTVVAPWFDRKHDYVLMSKFIELGAKAPVLKSTDPRIVDLQRSADRTPFRHVAHVEAPPAENTRKNYIGLTD